MGGKTAFCDHCQVDFVYATVCTAVLMPAIKLNHHVGGLAVGFKVPIQRQVQAC